MPQPIDKPKVRVFQRLPAEQQHLRQHRRRSSAAQTAFVGLKRISEFDSRPSQRTP